MVVLAHRLTIILATLSLALAYAWQAGWLGSGLVLAVGVLWLVAGQQTWAWLGTLLFVGLAGLAGFGAWLGLSPFFMLFGFISALAAWDLTTFRQQLQQSDVVEPETTLQRDHLRRLGLVTGLGLLLGTVALTIQFQLNLLWALLLGFLIIIGLSRVIRGVRERE